MISLLYIGNKLNQHEHGISVIETLGKQFENSGFIVHYAGTSKNQYIRLLEMAFKTIFNSRGASYILIDTYSTNAFWYAFLTGMIARSLKKKYIPILHGGNTPVRLKKSKFACNLLFKHSFANVAVSGYLKKAFDDAGYHAVTIPNNLDITNYTFKARETFEPKLLWVRAFHNQYNPNMAVDVLVELLKIHPEAELCMVGPDKDGSKAVLENYAIQKGVSEKVKITGKLSQAEWIALSVNYDFFINTTNVDNTPVSVIEAMSLGLAVVSTDPGGIPYLLESDRDAKLVNKNDSLQMAKCIEYLIAKPSETSEMVQLARQKAESFSWDKIKPLWLKLLE